MASENHRNEFFTNIVVFTFAGMGCSFCSGMGCSLCPEKGVHFAPEYAQIIENASSASFRPFFEAHISKDAEVVTDEWTGYKPLTKEYPKLKQIPSINGKSHPDMHIHIMNLKGWLRGIHHHCSKERLQGYLEEYHFRYNRRNNMDTIFDTLMKRMVKNEPKRLNNNK